MPQCCSSGPFSSRVSQRPSTVAAMHYRRLSSCCIDHTSCPSLAAAAISLAATAISAPASTCAPVSSSPLPPANPHSAAANRRHTAGIPDATTLDTALNPFHAAHTSRSASSEQEAAKAEAAVSCATACTSCCVVRCSVAASSSKPDNVPATCRSRNCRTLRCHANRGAIAARCCSALWSASSSTSSCRWPASSSYSRSRHMDVSS